MPFAPTPGTILDSRYRLEQKIGEWPLGETWVASDLRISSRAVEVRLTRNTGGWDPITAAQFDRECDTLARGPRGLIDRGRVVDVSYLVVGFDGPIPMTREMPQMSAAPYSGGPPTALPPYAPQPNAPFGSAPFQPIPGSTASSPFGTATPARPATSPPQATRLVGAVVIGILVVLLGAALAVRAVLERSRMRSPHASTNGTLGALPAQLDSTRIPVGASPILGNPGALVTIVEFGDFECPFCLRAERTLSELRTRYGSDVRIVWKNNPLPFHSHSQIAAEAAMAAGAQGRFWEMHDVLFANQYSLDRAQLLRYAAQIGLDVARFTRDLDTHVYAAQIAADQTLARTLSASGTPTFFINGTHLSGAQPIAAFTAAIDAALATARTIQPPNTAYATMTDTTPLAPPTPVPPTRPTRGSIDPHVIFDVPVTSDQPVLGNANALVTIVEFSDFQCPFCARAHTTLEEVRRRYGSDVRIVWRNHPLAFHTHAMDAAEAAMEVFAQQGSTGFWRYHDTLFANQRALGRADLERYASLQGIDMARFRDRLDRHVHRAAIDADARLGEGLGATGTPAFFVNGRFLSGAQPIERFADLIDETRIAANAMVVSGVARAQVYDRTVSSGATSAVYLPSAPAPAAANPGGAGGGPGGGTVYRVIANPRAPVMAGGGGTVLVEHFSDFQCPFCNRIAPTLDGIARTYAGRVRIVWRNYPLSFHPRAMQAAEAAMEVFAQQGNAGFWRYHDTLFANQRALERSDLESYAAAQGIDMRRFRAALDTHAHEAEIRADMAAADATGASIGTPATFVNGELVSGAVPMSEMQRVIDAHLRRP
jgi:protein-disulfide isomerase